MDTKAVAISGTVGKQVFATDGTQPKRLKGVYLSPLSANAFVRIRDGNASGTIMIEHSCLANTADPGVQFEDQGILFRNGMHVKVLGTNATCFLYIH